MNVYVITAMITSGPVYAGLLFTWRSSHKTHESLGKANGRGTGIEMMAKLQDDLADVKTTVLDIKEWQIEHTRQHVEASLLAGRRVGLRTPSGENLDISYNSLIHGVESAANTG